MSAQPRFIVVAGPTASGKSGVGLDLAKRFEGEVVNADSRQVFRGMDIGTAKPTKSDRELVPHHLFDVVAPDEEFDTARYSTLARAAVEEIAARGRLPIVVGGTGLYLRTLCRGLFPGPDAQPALRRWLEALEAEEPGALARWCRRLDPEASDRLHRNDRVRHIRALEVTLVTGRPLSASQRDHRFGDSLGEVLYLVLDPGRQRLRERIESRAREMFAGGLVEEVRGLWSRGYGPELRVLRSIGYREAGTVLRLERSVEEATADLIRSTWRFARRQVTWFRSEPGTRWIDPVQEPARAESLVHEFLDRSFFSLPAHSG